MAEKSTVARMSDAELQALVVDTDTGARAPKGLPGAMLVWVPVIWSLYQLWYASPLPFLLNVFILNDTQARAIHLAFGVFLAFTAFPAFKRSPRRRIPLTDWGFALIGAFAALYIFIFYEDLATRPGLPTSFDIATGVIGVLLLLEVARRTVGPALAVVAAVFLAYVFLGPHLPGLIAHKGASLGRAVSQFWLTTEGVFGVALGVSSSFVFLFVLFGSLLERAGAGNYFIKLSFAVLGHMRGGPAKAAVASSGLTGLISGSSIANVVTTGTFTIPLMKRVGYPPVKAGAVEVAASVNGQIMPPVMGAAAFLIAEYVGISYAEVVKHAFVPAILTYIALFYVVHLEAVKAGLAGLPRDEAPRPWPIRLMRIALGIAGLIILANAVYYGIGWTKDVFGAAATWMVVVATAIIYVALIALRARYPDLALDNPKAPVVRIPRLGETARTGLHFLLPVVVLIWCLMVENLSPGLSAFWATALLIVILLTQRPLTQLFRRDPALMAAFRQGVDELIGGLGAGARNMIGIALATATAGIVVGTVTLTGVGLVMTEVVEFLSGGNLLAMLGLTALICLILGMGMPTTASYIVVATLMAPVIVELAQASGLAVPLVAVHLFVFYFGLMADVTPPVGLASFAASAISGADPIRTGIQAFRYEIRTALLPFMFIFNHQLLLIDVDTWWHAALTIGGGLVAMLAFVAATQNHFLVRNRWYEGAALLLVCFTLYRPGFWMDFLSPPYQDVEARRIWAVAEALDRNEFLQFAVSGEDRSGEESRQVVKLKLGEPGPGAERLRRAGLQLAEEGDSVVIRQVAFRSEAAKLKLEPGWEVTAVHVPADRPMKEWMFVPALLLLGAVAGLQWTRRRASATAPAVG